MLHLRLDEYGKDNMDAKQLYLLVQANVDKKNQEPTTFKCLLESEKPIESI